MYNVKIIFLNAMGNSSRFATSALHRLKKSISALLNLSPHLTFHCFRSATTWAFQNGVSLQEIMKHGTWSSDAVWRYIKSVPSASSQVSRAFQHHLFL